MYSSGEEGKDQSPGKSIILMDGGAVIREQGSVGAVLKLLNSLQTHKILRGRAFGAVVKMLLGMPAFHSSVWV